MNNYDLMISCVGWEDRFIDSMNFHNNESKISQFLIFGVKEFSDLYTGKTSYIEENFSEKLLENKIQYISSYDDVFTWKVIKNIFLTHQLQGKNVLLDISTMPRYLIWYILHFLVVHKNNTTYSYFSPKQYGSYDWLTEDPLMPRLILKHSGIHLPNRNSILIIQTGFDTERVAQMINTYEPEKVILGAQPGEQFDNLSKNLKQHKERLNYHEIEYFSLDTFNGDYGLNAMKDQALQYREDKNIIMASFGPKLAAVEMFKLNLEIPEIGLVDVPVRKYNPYYSQGTNLESLKLGQIFKN